ncbi:MAG: P1 family peptidase [Candidatus Eremiobacteraeota bacterium]|nr:P1 family peptidase [Candidatus Eremiobacteraeota bacterium]
MRIFLVVALIVAQACCATASPARLHFGLLPSGPNDGITDVPGVRVAHLTKISGTDVRTGATAIVPNSDPWNHKVAAATQAFNGNGEMTGTHWIDEAGYLETPIILTDTLDVGRADDGVVSWMEQHYPQIGVHDDVPLPAVVECDDQSLNDIRGRHVSADDIVGLLDSARTGQFARGSVGAGTGMRAFGFKAGIGSASRVIPKKLGGYTVGVLVNDNTSSMRELLTIGGVHVGEALKNEYLPVYPKRTGFIRPLRGRQSDGSIAIIVATDAPLDSRQLHAVAKRIELGMGRVGLTSTVGSGDLFLAFSTGYTYSRDAELNIMPPQGQLSEDEEMLNAIYLATVEATEHAIYDALLSARTMTGRNGVTVYGLPRDRVEQMLRSAAPK